MHRRNIPTLFIFMLLFSAGGWLLTRPGLPAVEQPGRAPLVRAALGAGAGVAETTDPALTRVDADRYRHAPVVAVSVDVNEVPAGIDLDRSPYLRWLNGEADLEQERAPAAPPPAPPTSAAITAPTHPVTGYSQLLSFPALSFTDSGSIPPDPVLAVGPRHVVAAVNGAFAVYDKQGDQLLQPRGLSSFFDQPGLRSGCTDHPFDPDVLYDESADRFILLTAGMSGPIGDTLCIAVTQGADPTAGWYLYSYAVSPDGGYFDFPQAGVGRDALYVGANNVGAGDGPGQIWAFDKAAFYAGAAAPAVMRMLGSSLLLPTPNPMHLTGFHQLTWPTDGPHYVLAHHYDAALYELYAWNDPFGLDQWSTVGTIDLSAASGVPVGFPLDVPQQEGDLLAGNDARLWDLDYRNGSLWTTMHVSCTPGDQTINCVRWARIDPATAEVIAAGVIGTPEQHRFFPALAVNHCGDMLVGYSIGGEGMYPALGVSGVAAEAPAGRAPEERLVVQSPVPYDAPGLVPQRWGDYAALVVDPDGVTLWHIGPAAADLGGAALANWQTVISAFSFEACQPPVLHQVFLPVTS